MAYANNNATVTGEIISLSDTRTEDDFTFRAGKVQISYATSVEGMILPFTIRDDAAENLAQYNGVGCSAVLMGSLHTSPRDIKAKNGKVIETVMEHRLRVDNAQWLGRMKRQ